MKKFLAIFIICLAVGIAKGSENVSLENIQHTIETVHCNFSVNFTDSLDLPTLNYSEDLSIEDIEYPKALQRRNSILDEPLNQRKKRGLQHIADSIREWLKNFKFNGIFHHEKKQNFDFNVSAGHHHHPGHHFTTIHPIEDGSTERSHITPHHPSTHHPKPNHEPTKKPDHLTEKPTTKPVQPTGKPDQSTDKPVQPTEKPVQPTGKASTDNSETKASTSTESATTSSDF